MKKLLIVLAASLLITNSLSAQSFYDLNTIQSIEITFAQSNWDQLLDAEKAGNENYIMAQSVKINGVLFDSVGVKYKGNSTYNANQVKNPFHIELNTYKTQDYQGYTDIKLSNVAKDPSFLREVLSYQILRQYMHAPLSNYANVFVNGTLMGLYTSSEAVNKDFVDNKFYSKNNTFIKCNPPAGAGPGITTLPNLVYLGTDSTQYYTSYELKSDAGWKELIHLCDTLKNATTSIEKILDVDRALWMLAFDNALVNLDSYIGAFAQNYYLYRDKNGRFNSVVWDLNESFGRFTSTGSTSLSTNSSKQQMSHLLNATSANFPLLQKLLAVPRYKKMYIAHLKTILQENFSNNSYVTTGQNIQSIISSAVQADPNKFFTFANFQSNLTTDVTSGGGPSGGTTIGISNLMNARATYLLAQSDFTQSEPVISNVVPSTTAPSLNASFSIKANVTNQTAVFLGYRTDVEDAFIRVQMYDDGLHGDGSANDGVFGANVVMNNLLMQYYIYAENANAGKFSPVRAEHEYYTINLVIPPAGDLVINEISASNSTIQADPAGEFDDWIELYNNTNATINLSNYFLSDKIDNLNKWGFPSGTTIAPNGYLIIWADEDTTQAGLHCNFKLSSSGETLFLVNGSANIVDQLSYSNLATDTTYGRYPNGTGSFTNMLPTYNAQNSMSVGVSDVPVSSFSIKAYPNPTDNLLHIVIGGNPQQRNIQVYDLQGRNIYSNTIQDKLSLSTESWAPGMYLVRIDAISFKFMVSPAK